uniref:mitogen-activated protein kinase kinase n=1 Tax=Acrobeloides nanus TaxID=290746 RepID=A0A914CFF1_9BILA
MKSNKNNYLELGLTDQQLESTIQDILNNHTLSAEDLHNNVLVCNDYNDTIVSDFINTINNHSLNNALIACKNIQIIHRDVKPLNILLNRTGEIKLCDFGVSRILQDSLATTVVGTMAYWPPERFTGEEGKFDIRHDVWSLGIALVETALGSYPLSENSSFDASFTEIQNNIKNLKPDKFDVQLKHYSNDTMEFIHFCLRDIDNRPKYDGLTHTNFYQIYSEKKTPLDVAKIMNSIEESSEPRAKNQKPSDNLDTIPFLRHI